jgi:23S rRNA (uracil1939-C5)-methyltransferase
MQENTIDIKSLDMDARGVGHLQDNEDGTPGKVVFVEGALPGERVSFETFKKKKNWEAARMTALHRESSMRVKPKCEHFDYCGGCSMQHIEPSAQVAIKQRVLEDNLWHIGKVTADNIMRPMYGPTWGYRYRARLSVRWVEKKGTVLVGFKEKSRSSWPTSRAARSCRSTCPTCSCRCARWSGRCPVQPDPADRTGHR